jgi:EAL domain-containing protein (putative c-di-GMP-specific phosphodiesterase class I)
LKATLDDLNFQLAYDDFGAGQARLVELAEVVPDVLKFDIALIRDVGEAPVQRRSMLASLVGMAMDLGIQTLAEGIETVEEAEICTELGFQLYQGYYYGDPVPFDQLS